MGTLESRDQPVITIVNVPPTEGSVLNGPRSPDVYAGLQIPALGPAVIHGVLRNKGYQNVNTLDPRFNTKGTPFKIVSAKFTDNQFNLLANSDVVGISSMSRGREVSLRLAERVKRDNPNAIVIAGGPDPTFEPEKWLKDEKSADIVVRHEGEKTIVDVMQALKNGTSLEGISGISYKKDGQIINNPDRPLLSERELSDSPLPYFPKNIRENSDTHVIETKRGCPNNCHFCSVCALYDNTYRVKDSSYTIAAIKDGPKKRTFFVDDNFAHRSRLGDAKKGMQAIIDAGLNNREYYMQLDTVSVNVDPEFIKLAVKMGVFGVFLGVESIDPEILRNMRKAATADQNMKAAKIFADNLIFTQAMEIMGEKGETREKIEVLKKWNRKSGVNSVQIFPLIPLPGSAYAKTHKLLPNAEKDTNLISGMYVVSFPPDDFNCSELMQENINAYKDFYSLTQIQNSLRPLRHFFSNPEKSLKLTAFNVALRVYARYLLSSTLNSEYTKAQFKYLDDVDKEVYSKGKVIFEAEHHKSK